ncbi:MAG: DUF790 family protein [Planctomycetes bacterium]|nr:DUF790 family protein [Planctomycetota bacterium]
MSTVGVGPLPTNLLQWTFADGELVPGWLSDRDRPWLRELLGEARAAVGTSIGALRQRWQRSAPDPRAGRAAAIARYVVLELLRATATVPPVSTRRQRVFLAVGAGQPREQAVAAVATEDGIAADRLVAELYADLPDERLITRTDLDASRVILTANLALAQGLVRHATRARLRSSGGSRAVLKTAWLHGADLRVRRSRRDELDCDWSAGDRGPAAARRLAALLPLLPWTREFELRAVCTLPAGPGDRTGVLVLSTGDPLLPGPEPVPFDSRLERDFAAAFTAMAPDWQVVREPWPLQVGAGLAFPDFELCHPATGRRVLLEIAGLRDKAALPAKLALLDRAPTLLLCLPRSAITTEQLADPRIMPFGRRVDAAAVLARIDGVAYRDSR